VILTRDPSYIFRFMQLYNLLADRLGGMLAFNRLSDTTAFHKLQVDGENLAAPRLR
jgi:hypothetical protein